MTPAKSWSALFAIYRRQDDSLYSLRADGAVLRHTLQRQQTVVDVPAEYPQPWQVAESATNIEIIGVVESCFSAQGAGELKVLFHAGVFVIKTQAGLDARGGVEDPSRDAPQAR